MGDPLLLPKPGNARSDFLSAVARRIAERLDEPELVAVLLSGSATWGDADGTSDVDLVVLLDRPPPYREIVHRRITDLLGEAFPQGPLFADVDRLSASWFAESVLERGGWAHRLVHGLVLRDRAGFLADLQRRAVAAFRRPEAYRARFAQFRALRDEESADARAAADSGDGALARLRSRLGLGYAAASLLDLVDDRVSNHLVDAAVRGLATLGRADLGPDLLRGLALCGGEDGVRRGLDAWERFGRAALGWLADPAIGPRLSGEDRAWVAFTWGEETREELVHRRAVLTREGRLPALQYYLDTTLTVAVRLSVGKFLTLFEAGEARRMTVAEFHRALGAHPALLETWVGGLRLADAGTSLGDDAALADELLSLGERRLARLG